MSLFDCGAVMAAANGDSEFRLAARFWDADLRLASDDEAYLMRIRNGAIAAFAPENRVDATNPFPGVLIAGSNDGWRQMLSPVPKPFFQDLMAAAARENFRLEGDMLGFYPYYRAACRLFEIIRAISPSRREPDAAV